MNRVPLMEFATRMVVNYRELDEVLLGAQIRFELEKRGIIKSFIKVEIQTAAEALAAGHPEGIREVFASAECLPHVQGPELPPVEPTMNIVNQINAGLGDLRATLVAMTQGGVDTRIVAEHKAKYQLELIVDMIDDHQAGRKIPWSDRKLQVEEEFS